MTQNNESPEKVGQKLKEEREYRGFSKQEIAEYLGISQTRVEKIEKGQIEIESNCLERLAEIYELSVSQLRNPDNDGPDEELEVLARRNEDLSETDRTEIRRFAEFLKSRQRENSDD